MTSDARISIPDPTDPGQRLAVATEVDGDDAVVIGEVAQLVDPEGRRQHDPVEQDQSGALATFDDMDAAAVLDVHEVMAEVVGQGQALGRHLLGRGRRPGDGPVLEGPPRRSGDGGGAGPEGQHPTPAAALPRWPAHVPSSSDAPPAGSVSTTTRGTRDPISVSTSFPMVPRTVGPVLDRQRLRALAADEDDLVAHRHRSVAVPQSTTIWSMVTVPASGRRRPPISTVPPAVK